MNNSKAKQLVIATGANGAVGRAYLAELCSQEDTECIGVSRNEKGIAMEGVQDLFISDLTDEQETRSAMDELDISSFDRVLFIHTVGKFKFEEEASVQEEAQQPIDEEVFASNVESFINAADPLIQKVNDEQHRGHQVPLVLCALGSISDKDDPHLWRSYTRSKNELRELMKEATQLNPHLPLSMLFVNISTTETEAENQLRPHASAEEREYWLKPEELAKKSVPEMLAAISDIAVPEAPRWHEIDVYKPSPEYEEGFYSAEKALPRWKRAMKRKK